MHPLVPDWSQNLNISEKATSTIFLPCKNPWVIPIVIVSTTVSHLLVSISNTVVSWSYWRSQRLGCGGKGAVGEACCWVGTLFPKRNAGF